MKKLMGQRSEIDLIKDIHQTLRMRACSGSPGVLITTYIYLLPITSVRRAAAWVVVVGGGRWW